MRIHKALALLFAVWPALSGGRALAREAMSGHGEKPRPGESRFPAEHPRPTGALLGALPADLTLEKESVAFLCTAPGSACEVRHSFVLRSEGPTRAVRLMVITPTLAIHAEVEGIRLDWDLSQGPTPPSDATAPAPSASPERVWTSGGKAVAPGGTRPFALPGRSQSRGLHFRYFQIQFPKGGRRIVTLVSQSVAGFDRLSRPRTQAEVAFVGTRRPDYFTYHHELRLVDPAARPSPGGASGKVGLEIEAPSGLEIGANLGLDCSTARGRRSCQGEIPRDMERLLLGVAPAHRRPVGVFVTAGLGVTDQGVEAWLRGGLSLLLRRRLDLLTLAAETDAQERLSLALVYELFLPYRPSTHEMGAHAELGLVLDVLPVVTPGIRMGAAFHFGFIRVQALIDVYPGEIRQGDSPAWRLLVGAGLGI